MQTGDDILFTAPGPDFGTIPTATTEIVGTPGNAFNVYWIVTHFPIGSVVSGPFPQKDSPNVLDDENYILISWLPAPGASTYDLLVTKDLVLPKQPGQVWLAGGLTETEFRDTGQGLAFYDIGGIPLGAPQEEHIYFNNRDFKQPTLQFIPWPIQVSSIIFEDGSEQNTAGGGAAAAPPDRAVQFNDNAAFAGSSGLTFFQEFNELDIGAAGGPQIAIKQNSIRSTQTLSIDSNGQMALTSGNGNLILFADADFFLQNNFASISTNGITRAIDMFSVNGPITLQGAGTGNVGIGTQNPDTLLTVGSFPPIGPGYLLKVNGDASITGSLNVGEVTNSSFVVVGNTLVIGIFDAPTIRLNTNPVTSQADIYVPNLPSADPGPGLLWYDPADQNRVKFSP